MMVTFEEAADYLDMVADELPPEFFDGLNGGISLRPEVRRTPDEPGLYIMGEYINSWDMGKYIVIYYGSFHEVHRYSGREEILTELRRVLIHEFTHHMEGRAGERGLEVKDAEFMERYRKGEE